MLKYEDTIEIYEEIDELHNVSQRTFDEVNIVGPAFLFLRTGCRVSPDALITSDQPEHGVLQPFAKDAWMPSGCITLDYCVFRRVHLQDITMIFFPDLGAVLSEHFEPL